jgi:RNA polymerase sigma factor (sigma-70 family)
MGGGRNVEIFGCGKPKSGVSKMRRLHAPHLNADRLTSLFRAVHRNEPRALDRLLSAIRPVMFSYFLRHVDEETADDLAQIALIRIDKALPRIDPERANGFVAKIAANLLRTTFRRQARDSRRLAFDISPDEIESTFTADADTDQQDLLEAVRRVSVRSLPNELRDIVLALLRGQSRADIALKQRVSQITVRTRLMRARVILRQELNSRPSTRLLTSRDEATVTRLIQTDGESRTLRRPPE